MLCAVELRCLSAAFAAEYDSRPQLRLRDEVFGERERRPQQFQRPLAATLRQIGCRDREFSFGDEIAEGDQVGSGGHATTVQQSASGCCFVFNALFRHYPLLRTAQARYTYL